MTIKVSIISNFSTQSDLIFPEKLALEDPNFDWSNWPDRTILSNGDVILTSQKMSKISTEIYNSLTDVPDFLKIEFLGAYLEQIETASVVTDDGYVVNAEFDDKFLPIVEGMQSFFPDTVIINP